MSYPYLGEWVTLTQQRQRPFRNDGGTSTRLGLMSHFYAHLHHDFPTGETLLNGINCIFVRKYYIVQTLYINEYSMSLQDEYSTNIFQMCHKL